MRIKSLDLTSFVIFTLIFGCFILLIQTSVPDAESIQNKEESSIGALSQFNHGFVVVLKDGKAFMASGTKLFKSGEKFNGWFIEKITLNEVVLSMNGQKKSIKLINGMSKII